MPRSPARSSTGHLAIAALGGLAFAASLAYFAASFAGRFGVEFPRSSSVQPLMPAVFDVAIFSLFALHHSIFARTGLKDVVSRVLPPDLERSSYVWLASALFAGVCALWQPVPGVAWRVSGLARGVMIALQVAAGAATIVGARQLGVLSLAGVRQAFEANRPASPPVLDDSGLYGIVRHPIYLAWFILVWAVPVMTGTRLVFAATSCLYLLIAVPFEERDLRRVFGAAYTAYARKVRWRIVPFLY